MDDQAGVSQLANDENVQYRKKAREKYRNLLKEFELRCHRAALMNYTLSSSNFETSRIWEYVSFPLGSAVTTGGLAVTWLKDDLSWRTWLGFGLVTTAVHMLTGLASQLFLSRSLRANDHTKAGAAWQRLEQTAQSYLIQLDDPQIDIQTIAQRYEDLVKERENACVTAVIPSKSYYDYSNEVVFKDLRGRKEMLAQYQEEFPDGNDD